jgi:NAD(P)-dependent dehydrogenase (short-subunit alcohol dehydrogenase family)
MLSEIQDGQALVVGASQGIGFGFVKHLLQTDNIARIFATYRRPRGAAELLKLADEHPQRLHCLPLDVTDESQIATSLSCVQRLTPRLHLVINSVGLLHDDQVSPEKSLQQLNADHLLRAFQVNSVGGILLAKHLLPLLRHDQPSLFATLSAKIGSIGDNRLGGWYGYRASKAALNMFLKTAAIEYSRKSKNTILVMLHPGTTDTQLSRPFQRGVPPDKLFSVDRTVTQLMTVLSQLDSADHGAFFSWDGSRLPW